jgi:hypothetical protein
MSSELTEDGLFRLEMIVRTEAEAIRMRNPAADLDDASVPEAVKVHIRNERHRADAFDLLGNMLCGMQADWPAIGPMIREGLVLMRKMFKARKPKPQQMEDAA